MGVIISKIEDVENVRWTQLRKGQIVNAKRVLAIDETQVIIELDNGKLTVAGYRHSPNGNWAVVGYGLDKFSSAVLDALVRFGILTKEQVRQHKANAKAASEAVDRKYAKERLVKACQTLGIPVPEVPE